MEEKDFERYTKLMCDQIIPYLQVREKPELFQTDEKVINVSDEQNSYDVYYNPETGTVAYMDSNTLKDSPSHDSIILERTSSVFDAANAVREYNDAITNNASITINTKTNTKTQKSMFDLNSMFNGMFGNVAPGMCKLTMNGGIAVKCHDGYKSYNIKKKRLVNISNFGFSADNFFFVIPTTKVNVGDIILQDGKPKCVISVSDESIKVIDYDNSEIREIVPTRHVFMGATYFYGKIVSLFGSNFKTGKGMNKFMSMMLMMNMMGSNRGSCSNGFDPSMLLMMNAMGSSNENPFENMLSGMNLDFSDCTEESEEDNAEEEED